MSDSRGFEPPFGNETEALLRLIRSAQPSGEGGLELVDEEALAAYVCGRANPSQVEQIQAVMARSASFRRQLLELMRLAEEPSTETEREEFDRASAPPVVTYPSLQKLPGPGSTVRSPVPRAGRGWLDWMLGGWAAAATAACALLVFTSRPRMDVAVSPTPGKPQPVQPAPGPSKYSLNVTPTVRLRGPSRGVEETVPVVTIGPTTTTLRMIADPPDIPNGGQVTVRLLGPEGSVLLNEPRPVEDLFGTEVLTLQAPEPLRAGRYVLEISWQENSTAQTTSLPFIIRIR